MAAHKRNRGGLKTTRMATYFLACVVTMGFVYYMYVDMATKVQYFREKRYNNIASNHSQDTLFVYDIGMSNAIFSEFVLIYTRCLTPSFPV